MKENAREREAMQLNNASAPREEENFSLEDIVREFGGWTQREEEPKPAEEETLPVAQAPEEPESEQLQLEEQEPPESVEEELKPEETPVAKQGRKFEFIEIDLNAPKQEAEAALETVFPLQLDVEEEPIEEKPKLHIVPEKKKASKPKTAKKEAYVAPDAALRQAKKALRGLALRTALSFVVSLLAVLITLWINFDWPMPFAKPKGSFVSLMLLVLFAISIVLSADVLLRGVRQMLRLRFNLESSLTITALMVLVDSLTTLSGSRLPLCAPVCVALLVASWAHLQRLSANRKIFKTMTDAQQSELVLCKHDFWHGSDCLVHLPADQLPGAGEILEPDGCEKAMRVYAPLSTAISLVLAVVIAAVTAGSFFWIAAVLLIGSMPVMGFFAFTLPWKSLAARLSKSGAALMGWKGIKTMCGNRSLVITGHDLFPKANVSFNGLKVFGNWRVNQVVSYAGTMMAASGSELTALFGDLMEEYGARSYPIGSFRRYEGGGFGAEIAGDVALTGSRRFMRLMGVQIPDDLNVNQALYLSINGTLAGVFALSYKASASVRTGLVSVLHSRTLTPILATRDFLISPQMLAKRYRISADSMEFPAVAERVALSDPSLPADGAPAAVLTRSGFSGYAGAVLGARSLRAVTLWGVVFSYISGFLGLLIMLALTRVGATDVASAANLLQYMLLWMIPALLLGLWVRR